MSQEESPGVDEHDAGGSEGDSTSIGSRRETSDDRTGAAGSSRSWEGSSSSTLMSSTAPFSGQPTSLFCTLPPPPAAVPTTSTAPVAAAPPKRLFSTATSSSTLSTHRHSTFSDCGSEMARSLDDLTLNNPRPDDKSEGTIRLPVSNVSTLRQKTNTSFYTIANLPWRLAAKTECSKRTSQLRFFSVYIDCNPESESTLWECDALVEFRLVNQRDDLHHFSRHFTNKFNFNSNNWGFPSFIEWTELLAPEKGFIKADRVVVEARITVNKVTGVRQKPAFHFRQPSGDMTDTALIINGVKLYISRQYLALYSPVFAAMFYGRFQEREKTEIPIEDVILEEFIELLEVVYPSHKPVSADNVEYLLDLGDKFSIQFVMDEAEKFLIATDEIQVVTKLLWADHYTLARLQDACIRTFKNANEIKQIKASEEYKNLSDKTRAALLEKILKLLP